MSVRLALAAAIAALLTVGAGAPAGEAGITTAKVFAAGSGRGKLLFTMRREEKVSGPVTRITEAYTDPSGKQALRSVTVLENGRFKSYDLEQDQIGESAKIEARGGKIDFEYRDRSGERRSNESWADNFVLSTTLSRYLRAHWSEVMAGKDVEVRFGVPERLETVGFKFFKTGVLHAANRSVADQARWGEHDVLECEMKPSSMFISMLVKPLYFYYDIADMRLIEFDGRVLPKQRDGSSWKDLDAETVY